MNTDIKWVRFSIQNNAIRFLFLLAMRVLGYKIEQHYPTGKCIAMDIENKKIIKTISRGSPEDFPVIDRYPVTNYKEIK